MGRALLFRMAKQWIAVIFTLVIAYVAFTQLDFDALFLALQNVELEFVALAFGVWWLILFAKFLKWKTVIRGLDSSISLADSAKTLLIGLFIGVITPGRIGDFVRVAYIEKKMGAGRSVMAVIIDRALDIGTLLVFGAVGMTILRSTKGIEIISPEVIAVLLLGFIGVLFAVFNRRIARILWKKFQFLVPKKFHALIAYHGKEFYDSVPLIKKNSLTFALAAGYSVLAWSSNAAMGFFLMQAAHIPVGWEAALIVIPVISLVEIIPFGVAGAGTRELAAVLVFGAYGVSAELAIIFSILYFIVGYGLSFVAGGIMFSREPPQLKKTIANLTQSMETK